MGSDMNKEKLEYYAALTVTAVGVGIFAFVFVKYLFFLILPFLIAWAVAFAVRPLSVKLSNIMKIPKKPISVILSVLLMLAGIGLFVGILAYGISEAWNFISEILAGNRLGEVLSKVLDPLGSMLGDMEGREEIEKHIGDAVYSALSSLLSGLLSVLTTFVTSVPKVFIFVLVTVISAVYFSLDLENINAFVKKIMPKKIFSSLVSFKNKFLSSIVKYLRAYFILMLITFVIMLAGFLVLRVEYALLFSVVVAILDALPLIGVGTLLVPWGVYNIIFGDLRLGIGLCVLFILHEVIRQFIEPKIIGKNLGIHPIVSLVLLYVGYCVFGFLGLLLIPLLTVIIKILFDKNNSSAVE